MTQHFPRPQPPYGQPDPHQWQGYGQATPAPKKKRKWPWIVGGVVLLLVLLSAIGGRGSSTSPTPAAGGSAAAQPAQSDGQPIAAGETVTSSDLQVTAEPVRKVKPKYTDPQLCSRVSYRNAGSDEEFFNVLDWKIQSPDGVQQLATYALDKGLSSGQLAPGGTVSGDVCRQGAGGGGEYLVILDRTFLDPIRWKSTL
jgi:hypothetical protein